MNTKTKVLAVVGTVVLGAVGNALWELVKPGLGWLSTAALNVITLGIQTLRDDIYVEIARGFREKVAENVLGFALGLSLVTFAFWYASQTIGQTVRLFFSLWPMRLLVLFSLVYLTLMGYRIAYINSSIAYFEQLLAISSPYLSADERIQMRSSFAQIQNSTDYARLTERLATVAKARGQRVPPFRIY